MDFVRWPQVYPLHIQVTAFGETPYSFAISVYGLGSQKISDTIFSERTDFPCPSPRAIVP